MAEATAEHEVPAEHKDAWIPHVIPFVAWIFLMGILGEAAGWKYATRSAVCLALLLYFRPWRWYDRIQWKHVPLSIGVGVFVCAFWILFESDFMARFEIVHRMYMTIGTQMPWSLAAPLEQIVYSPDRVGWGLTIARLLGSAIVIAIIEEFFWRGWMYRWIVNEDFLSVDHGTLRWKSLLFMALMFSTIHHRWVAAFVCGICYGLLYIRTRDIWAAATAHMVTNFLLGVYVLWSGKYEFW